MKYRSKSALGTASGESERRSRPSDVFGKAMTSRTVCAFVKMDIRRSIPAIETGSALSRRP